MPGTTASNLSSTRGQENSDAREATSRVSRRRLVNLITDNAVWLGPSLLALVIGCWNIQRPVLSMDEAVSWDAANRSAGQIANLARVIDGVLAPYYLFLHFWIAIFGDSELSLRMPSCLAAAAAVGVTAAIGRRLFNARVGIIAATLLEILPAFSRYAQEARPYGLVLFLACLSTLLLLCSLDNPRPRRWIGYGCAIAALGLFHLFGLLLLGGHAVFVAARWWDSRRRVLVIGWILSAAAAGFVCLPLAFLGASERNQLWWVAPVRWNTLLNLPDSLFLSSPIGWTVVGLAVGAVWQRHRVVAALAITALAPAVELYVISLKTPLWVPRYLLFALCAWCLLAAVTVSRSWARAGIAIVLVLLLAFDAQTHIRSETGHDTPDYRAVAQFLHQRAESGDGIIYSPKGQAWWTRPALSYYARRSNLVDVLATKTPAQNSDLIPALCAHPQRCLQVHRIWVVVTGDNAAPLTGYSTGLSRYVTEHYRVVSTDSVKEVTLVQLVRRGSG